MSQSHIPGGGGQAPMKASPAGLQPGLLGACDMPMDAAAQFARQTAQLHEMRAEMDRLGDERDRLLEQQRRIADLLHSPHADKIVHDLRNLLNELQLYKMLAETQPR